jgi:hypothetical protein
VREAMAAAGSVIFISYRRQEASYLAAWLHDSLCERFGVDRVFLDIDSIKPGRNFVTAIAHAIAQSALMIILIGPRWLALGKEGRRRLDDLLISYDESWKWPWSNMSQLFRFSWKTPPCLAPMSCHIP